MAAFVVGVLAGGRAATIGAFVLVVVVHVGDDVGCRGFTSAAACCVVADAAHVGGGDFSGVGLRIRIQQPVRLPTFQQPCRPYIREEKSPG